MHTAHSARGRARGRGVRQREEEKKHYTTRHCETGTTSAERGLRSFCLRPAHRSLPTMRSATVRRVASRLRRRARQWRRACSRRPGARRLRRQPNGGTFKRRVRRNTVRSVTTRTRIRRYRNIARLFSLQIIRSRIFREECTCLRDEGSFEIEKRK